MSEIDMKALKSVVVALQNKINAAQVELDEINLKIAKELKPVKCNEFWIAAIVVPTGHPFKAYKEKPEGYSYRVIEPPSYAVVKKALFGDNAREADEYWMGKMNALVSLGMIKEAE